MKMPKSRSCKTCKFLWQDWSVNASDFENNDDNWTDEEIEKYYENGEEGCPHWQEMKGGEW